MKKMMRFSLILFLSLLSSFHLAAQIKSTLRPDKITKIEELIRTEMAQGKIPGLSVAIINNDQLSYAKGFGMADLEDSTPAQSATVYRLGSLSKTITGVAVMQLAERGKLDLDAPVQKYCAAYPIKQWPLTSRQLLAHLGGVRDYNNQKFLEEYFSTRHYNSINESLDIFKNDPLQQEPGTKYSYSTYGYNLLGCAIEGASGMTYEGYLQENILKPAGMKQTLVDDIFQIIAGRARGYGKTREGVMRNTGLADTSNKIPAGGLVSTVEDFVKFSLALQNGTLLRKETIEQIWTQQKTLDGKQTPYGLGWRIGERNGIKEVYHGGAAAGFSTFLYIMPEKKVSVVLMANMELLGQKQRDDLARRIADLTIQ